MADEVRRRTWRRHPLEADGAARYEAPDAGVETLAERQALRDVIRQIIDNDLTPRQRQALVGRFFDEKPLVVLATELNTDKDNVYKLIHDARKHLKRALRERGLTAAEVLSSFHGAGR
jgi:RNA polymerase sigma-70 factor (ECF subfamily)